jgi:IstB-like ATP binding protein
MEVFERERQTPETLAAMQKADADKWWSIIKELLNAGHPAGKSWLACALAHKACRDNRSVLYQRLPKLFADLALARGDAAGRNPRAAARRRWRHWRASIPPYIPVTCDLKMGGRGQKCIKSLSLQHFWHLRLQSRRKRWQLKMRSAAQLLEVGLERLLAAHWVVSAEPWSARLSGAQPVPPLPHKAKRGQVVTTTIRMVAICSAQMEHGLS